MSFWWLLMASANNLFLRGLTPLCQDSDFSWTGEKLLEDKIVRCELADCFTVVSLFRRGGSQRRFIST